MEKYNSIFQYEEKSMSEELLYQKGLNLGFLLNKGDAVFDRFKIESRVLNKDGKVVYELYYAHPHGSNKEDFIEGEGFKLITEKRFKDINIMATPNRNLYKEVFHNPNLLDYLEETNSSSIIVDCGKD